MRKVSEGTESETNTEYEEDETAATTEIHVNATRTIENI